MSRLNKNRLSGLDTKTITSLPERLRELVSVYSNGVLFVLNEDCSSTAVAVTIDHDDEITPVHIITGPSGAWFNLEDIINLRDGLNAVLACCDDSDEEPASEEELTLEVSEGQAITFQVNVQVVEQNGA